MCFTHLICGQKQNSLALRLPHQSFGRKPVNCSPPIPFSDLWEKPSLVLRFPLLTGDRKPVYSSILYVRQSKPINLVLRFPLMNPIKEYVLVIERTASRCVFQRCVSPNLILLW